MIVDIVLSFGSTHVAMAADKALGEAGVEFTMIPTPTAVSAGCGISLRMPRGEFARAQEVLSSHVPPIAADAHSVDDQGVYEPLSL